MLCLFDKIMLGITFGTRFPFWSNINPGVLMIILDEETENINLSNINLAGVVGT